MAEKIKSKKIEKEEYIHQFYCDDCGKFLGESVEWDDGYYKEFGEYSAKMFLDNWYEVHKNLCNDCKNRFNENIIKYLKELGFKKN